MDPDGMPRREDASSSDRRPSRRRGKIFTREDGEYIDFVEIDEKIDFTATDSASSRYTPREPQVSDAEWEDVR